MEGVCTKYVVEIYETRTYNYFIQKKRGFYMEKYTKDKMYDIMEITQCNQANMLKRLDKNSKFSSFVLIIVLF